MDVGRTLLEMGGVATRAALDRATSRSQVDRALRAGVVVRDAHGRYALPVADASLRAANALTGTVSHLSAALHWGWEVKEPPAVPVVTVRRTRSIAPARREGIELHRADLAASEIDGLVTSRRRTLLDCLRGLAFDEALTVADSALRHDDVTGAGLESIAASVRGPGAPQARRVAREATGKAANPFESVLRAISLDVPGLRLTPQVTIRDAEGSGRPDLVEPYLRWVVEAESYAWHSSRRALRRDCRRYTRLALLGWRVMRFAWEDVMHHPDYVRDCMARLVAAGGPPVPRLTDRAAGGGRPLPRIG